MTTIPGSPEPSQVSCWCLLIASCFICTKFEAIEYLLQGEYFPRAIRQLSCQGHSDVVLQRPENSSILFGLWMHSLSCKFRDVHLEHNASLLLTALLSYLICRNVLLYERAPGIYFPFAKIFSGNYLNHQLLHCPCGILL